MKSNSFAESKRYIKTFENYLEQVSSGDWIVIENPNSINYDSDGEKVEIELYSIFKLHKKGNKCFIWTEFIPGYGYVDTNIEGIRQLKHNIIEILEKDILFSSKSRKKVEEHRKLLMSAKKYNL
jgi:hypothetical protein